MQNGAHPRYHHDVKIWLKGKFRNNWIGRGGPIPDLTPCEFFVGLGKEEVYRTRPNTLEEVKTECVKCYKIFWHNSFSG